MPFTDKQQEEQKECGYQITDRLANVTEIFIPYFHFGGKALQIQSSVGESEYIEEKQTLYHYYDGNVDKICITLNVLNHKTEGYSCNLM